MLMIPMSLMAVLLFWTIGQFPVFMSEAMKSARFGYLSNEAFTGINAEPAQPAGASEHCCETKVETAASKVVAH